MFGCNGQCAPTRLILTSDGRRSVGHRYRFDRCGGTHEDLGLSLLLLSTVLLSVATVYASARAGGEPLARGAASSAAAVPLKDAKLNIEHNATDKDTGFQGFVDSEGWRRLDVRGPGGAVLTFEGRGTLAKLGLTELFFESVEPENADVPIDEMLAKLPEGNYTIAGPAQENGKSAGRTSGTAWLTHDIPAGPKLVSPAEGATVPTRGVVARWKPVSKTITGEPVTIIAYQLIIEKDVEPHRHMIGKLGLSMYLPRSVTSIAVPNGFLSPARSTTGRCSRSSAAATRRSRPARSERGDGRRSQPRAVACHTARGLLRASWWKPAGHRRGETAAGRGCVLATVLAGPTHALITASAAWPAPRPGRRGAAFLLPTGDTTCRKGPDCGTALVTAAASRDTQSSLPRLRLRA